MGNVIIIHKIKEQVKKKSCNIFTRISNKDEGKTLKKIMSKKEYS